MINRSSSSAASAEVLLSKVTRYEALFELAGAVNAAADIESAGEVLARRLKYIVDVYCWRYICFDSGTVEGEGTEPTAVVVDGYRGRASVTLTDPATLSSLETRLWRDRTTCILCGDQMLDAVRQLPAHFQKDDLEQISVNTLVENGETRALFLFAKRRQPITDLDVKCLAMVCGFFHRKIHMLWEQQKLRDLERAYLEQDLMLRQSERLATLGRLSAGMAHELNNPAAAARQAAEQLSSSIDRLERAQRALGESRLSSLQQDLVAELEQEAAERAKKASSLDPIERSDLEQEVEDWLARNGIADPWEHSSTLVAMGLCAAELDELTTRFDPGITPVVIDYFGSKFTAYTLLQEIGHGSRRIAEIVQALKSYSYMDQAPVQSVDVREGLNDTLVMLRSRLRDGIEVDLDYAEDLPRVQGYGSELNQVWTNLIDNAIDAMGGTGALDLRAYDDDGWVVVEISDSGEGIPIEEQERVFDPFYTTKGPGEGTGLGLNISHSIIVEKHNGQISVESKPGATRFTVKIPIASP